MLLYRIYRLLTYLLLPFAALWIAIRLLKKKELSSRVKEKFAITSLKRPQGKLIWCHAASVGELKMLEPLLEKFINDGHNILVTTITKSAAQVFEKMCLANTQHQFLPIDFAFFIKKFLNHWQPNLCIIAESEIWPNLIYETYQHAIPMALVNASMTQKSFKLWSWVRSLIHQMFARYALIIPSSEEDRAYLSKFTSNLSNITYNIKYAAKESAYDAQQLALLENTFATHSISPIICFASTHQGEEGYFIEVYKKLIRKWPNLGAIIIPRHPHRGQEILNLVTSHHLKGYLRSTTPCIENLHQAIYIADTLGELGLFYRLSSIVVMGGSFIKWGGHNILEPARLDNALIIGNSYYEFTKIVNDFATHSAVQIVSNSDELYSSLEHLLSDPPLLLKYSHAAKSMLSLQSNLLDEIYIQLKVQLSDVQPN